MFGSGKIPQEPPQDNGAEQFAQKPNLPLKTFVVTRVKFNNNKNTGAHELESFYIRAHFLSNLDGGGVAFNIYDFETPPQGITTVRVLNDYYDITQELELPSDIIKA